MNFSRYVKDFIKNSKNNKIISILDYNKIIEYEKKNEIDDNDEFYFKYNNNYKLNNKIPNEITISNIMDNIEENYNYSDSDNDSTDNEFEY